jgi:hypothetical protein
MTITFTPESASPVPLAAEGREAPDGLRLGYEDAVQTVRPLRAASAVQHHRGGRLFSLSWSTTRQHADQETADAFALEHTTRLVGKSGNLVLGGRMTLTSATVRLVDLAVIGHTTRASYSAQGVL